MDSEAQNFGYVAQVATDTLYDLSGQFRKCQKIGSRISNQEFAQELNALGNQTGITMKAVLRATEWPNSELGVKQKNQKAELETELKRLTSRVKEFQATVAETLKRQQRQKNTQNPPSSSQPDEQSSLLSPNEGYQSLQRTQVLDQLDQTTLDLHSAILQDRESDIIEIQRGAHEINAIFQDLGILVTEQGQQLDTIEDNIADLARQTEGAGRQLTKAQNYQRSKGKWKCIALLVLLAITILVALSIIS